MSRIAETFAALKRLGRGGFIPFITAGDPADVAFADDGGPHQPNGPRGDTRARPTGAIGSRRVQCVAQASD